MIDTSHKKNVIVGMVSDIGFTTSIYVKSITKIISIEASCKDMV